jgi:hypothetical protein
MAETKIANWMGKAIGTAFRGDKPKKAQAVRKLTQGGNLIVPFEEGDARWQRCGGRGRNRSSACQWNERR